MKTLMLTRIFFHPLQTILSPEASTMISVWASLFVICSLSSITYHFNRI
ncbi:hypothetical protein Hanom_Chr03g00242901 [Helianthus anomalus]